MIWLTGLSGAGKTTVATALVARLRERGPVLMLDGDRLREVFGGPQRYDSESRKERAFAYARLCRELAEQQIPTVIATISMFHDVRRWNRTSIPGYVEVYLRVPLPELQRRDPKGIYAANSDVAGKSFEVEEPESPDLVIDHHGSTSPNDAVEAILDMLKPKGWT